MSVALASKEDIADALITNILLWKNPYDIFDAQSNTSLDEIHKKYKKISLQIHPDKCKLPKAVDAFDALKKALSMLKDPEYEELRGQFQKVMEHSRNKMKEMWKKENKVRITKEDNKAFEKDVKRMIQKLLLEMEASTKRAEEIKLANDRREKEQKMKEQEQLKKEIEHEQKWEEARDYRVGSWRFFQNQNTRKRKNPEDDIANLELPDSPSSSPKSESVSPKEAKETIKEEPKQIPKEVPKQILKELPKQVPKPPTKVAKTESEAKSIPVLGIEPPKKKKYTPKPIKPPKIKLT